MLTVNGDTILGDVPDGWEARSVRSLLRESYAGDWGADEGEVAVRVLRSTNFTASGDLDLGEVAVRFFDREFAANCELLPGDILLERSGGGPEQPVGRIAFVRERMPCTTVSNFVQVLRPDPDVVDPNYLGWALFEIQRRGVIERLQQQSTQMRNLNYRDYLRLHLPYPSPDEQRQIAGAFQAIQQVETLTRQRLDALRRLKSSILQAAFEGGRRDCNQLVPFKIHRCYTASVPAHWERERLGVNLLTVEYGSNAPSNDFGAGYPIVAIPQVVAPRFTLGDLPHAEMPPEEANTLRLLEGDVLLIRTNGNAEYIGKSTLVRGDVANDHVVFASYLIRVRANPERLLGSYLNYFLASPLGRRQAAAVANTSAGNNNISKRAIQQLCFPRPPIPEQQEVVELLDAVEDQIEALGEKLGADRAMQRALLTTLLIGSERIASPLGNDN